MHVALIPALAALISFAATPVTANQLEEGRKLARKCSACHGKNGMSRDPEAPNLAGQSELYLEKSIKDFRDGHREDRRMTIVVKRLSNEDIKALAKWYSSFKITVEPPE
ncbi:MAG: cytochrome c [Pseudomonadota bacterium]